MPRVAFTPQLQRFLDEHGHVRPHVAVFVGGARVKNRRGLSDSVDVVNGLPAQSYDLIYRHALDIAGDGRTLAMGSTTGSVWLSDNGGDRWKTVSNHLPPVYAVRFGA